MAICIFYHPVYDIWYSYCELLRFLHHQCDFFPRKTEIAQFTFKQYVPKEKARYNKYDRNLNPYVQINVKIIFKN